MTDTTLPTVPPAVASGIIQAQSSQADVSALLSQLQDASPSAGARPSSDLRYENQLALARLGIATSLFNCLRTKHASTAARGLRVAFSCSAWAERQHFDDETRDRFEVAALLHDLGKIGIPDRILRKPAKLTLEERQSMECSPELSCEILRGSTDDQELLNIVRHSKTWFNASDQANGPSGTEIPVCSRMLLIAGAFDAMTTEHVYRAALSRERALQQLMQGSGTQFDPKLVIDFVKMLEDRPEMLQGPVVARWLKQLQPSVSNSFWTGASTSAPNTTSTSTATSQTDRVESKFHDRLLLDLKDGVAFTSAEGIVTHWNAAMESLTGISATAVIGQTWNANAFGLRGPDLEPAKCPREECLSTNSHVSRAMSIHREHSSMPVQVTVALVNDDQSGVLGTVVTLHDTSERTDLEEQLVSLHHQTTVDSLTGVSNRAHFDDTIASWTDATIAGGPSFSLIICDIDHFKKVNDIHGHPAGDDALIKFAAVLMDNARPDDLVARYGGEEFLLLAADCDNGTAVKRAEAIRSTLESTPLPSLKGEAVTASFGVTEYQPGDTSKTVLARADRALLKAKDNGRNRVIQLGCGQRVESADTEKQTGWFSWLGAGQGKLDSETEFDILTPVPADLAIEKLKGFIADHGAEIISVNESQVALKISAFHAGNGRRTVDQHIGLKVQLTLSEGRPGKIAVTKTKVHIEIEPIRSRNRRSRHLKKCVDLVVASLRSYLMGEIIRSSEQ